MNKKFKKRFKKDFLMFYLGIGLYVFFLVLWFVTLPKAEVVKSFDEMTVDEQIDSIKKNESAILDNSNYLRASMMDNNAYCFDINDSNLQAQCFDEISNFEELVIDDRSNQDIMDESNYLRATMTGDISYCDEIVNPDLKHTCINGEEFEDDEFLFDDEELEDGI